VNSKVIFIYYVNSVIL